MTLPLIALLRCLLRFSLFVMADPHYRHFFFTAENISLPVID